VRFSPHQGLLRLIAVCAMLFASCVCPPASSAQETATAVAFNAEQVAKAIKDIRTAAIATDDDFDKQVAAFESSTKERVWATKTNTKAKGFLVEFDQEKKEATFRPSDSDSLARVPLDALSNNHQRLAQQYCDACKSILSSQEKFCGALLAHSLGLQPDGLTSAMADAITLANRTLTMSSSDGILKDQLANCLSSRAFDEFHISLAQPKSLSADLAKTIASSGKDVVLYVADSVSDDRAGLMPEALVALGRSAANFRFEGVKRVGNELADAFVDHRGRLDIATGTDFAKGSLTSLAKHPGALSLGQLTEIKKHASDEDWALLRLHPSLKESAAAIDRELAIVSAENEKAAEAKALQQQAINAKPETQRADLENRGRPQFESGKLQNTANFHTYDHPHHH